MRLALAFALAPALVVACGKGGDGTGGWVKAKRVEASATASGVGFTLQVPEGLGKAGDDKYPEWKDKEDLVSFQVSAVDHPIRSVEAAIDKVVIPGDQSFALAKQEALPDGGFMITKTTPPNNGVLFVDVFRSAGPGALQCHGSARATGISFDDMAGTFAVLEQVCLSMKPTQ